MYSADDSAVGLTGDTRRIKAVEKKKKKKKRPSTDEENPSGFDLDIWGTFPSRHLETGFDLDIWGTLRTLSLCLTKIGLGIHAL